MPIKPGTQIVSLIDGRTGWLSHYTNNGKRGTCVIDKKSVSVPTPKIALTRYGKPPPPRPSLPEPECSDGVRRLAVACGLSIREALEALSDE